MSEPFVSLLSQFVSRRKFQHRTNCEMSICLDEVQRGEQKGGHVVRSAAPSLALTQCFWGAQEGTPGAPGWLIHDNCDRTGEFRGEGPASAKVHNAEGLLEKQSAGHCLWGSTATYRNCEQNLCLPTRLRCAQRGSGGAGRELSGEATRAGWVWPSLTFSSNPVSS